MSDLEQAKRTIEAAEALERRSGDERRKSSRDVPKVPCPRCGHWQSAVRDGRPYEDGYRRKRVCSGCGAKFYTMERAA
jgi:hypothetical protein